MTVASTSCHSRAKHHEMTREEFSASTPRLLNGAFCSATWMLDSFDVICKSRGPVFRFIPNRYPPGGTDTRMVRCPACGQLSPRDMAADDPCLDCQDVRFVAMVEKFQNDPTAAQLKDDLSARWWRSRPPSEEAATNPGALLHSRSIFSMACDVSDIVDDRLAEEQAFADNEPVTSDERPMGKGYLPLHKVLQHLTWLFNPKEGSTRPRGSQIFLLGEDINTLQAEIDHYHRKVEALGGQIAGHKFAELVIPSACRIDNPYKKDRPFRRRKIRR